MLDDIRNSSLLIMVSAVVMAVVAIAVQPEPHREPPAARSAAAGPPAQKVMAPRRTVSNAPTCDATRPPAFAAATQAGDGP